MDEKILVVDDEEIVCRSLCKLLIKTGYRANYAMTGDEAIEKIKKEDVDLALIDIRMPGMNGILTYEEIRKFKKQKTLFMTGYTKDDMLSSVRNRGFQCLYKPLDSNDLIHSIKTELKGTLQSDS